MGASASVLEKLTPEQQAEINALVEKLKGEGVAEEEIEKQVREQFSEILASIEVEPVAEAEAEAEAEDPAAAAGDPGRPPATPNLGGRTPANAAQGHGRDEHGGALDF